MKKKFKKMLISIAIIYMVVCAFFYFNQRNIQYQPSGKILKIEDYQKFNQLIEFNEFFLTTDDNEKIFTWFKKPSKNQKIIVYFQGNAGNLSDRIEKFDEFSKSNFAVLAISYRGFVNSSGKSSEAGLIKDAETSINFLKNLGYQQSQMIFYGESLGSGVAIQMAKKYQPFAVILESPYSSIASVAKDRYWFLPIDLMLKDKFESIKYISEISSPILIFHGKKDRVIKISESEKLIKKITAKNKLVIDENLGHVDFKADFIVKEFNKFATE
jgi:hypothetical protein